MVTPMVKQAGPRWNAVSVIPATGGCEAARGLKGRRFLSADAPRLPLPQCASPVTCQCVYKKYADRRAGPRREAEQTGLQRAVETGQERRRKRGRRSTDLSEE
jgi:hypothetical protein